MATAAIHPALGSMQGSWLAQDRMGSSTKFV